MTSTTIEDSIIEAHQSCTPPHQFPFSSFSGLFYERVHDLQLSQHTFLSYHDDDQSVHRTYTYGEFGEAVAKMASVLRDRLRIKRGDRLATVLFNHDQTVLIYFAAWALGITVVPINIAESSDKKRYILEHSEASVVLCWCDAFDEIQECVDDIPSLREAVLVSDDPHRCELTQHLSHAKPTSTNGEGCLQDEALIIYTSGTTGPPKGVILTMENLLIDADAITQWHGFGQGDCLMCVLPIHHVNGIVVTLITPFYFRGKAVLNKKFKSGLFWSRVQEEHVVCASVVPTLLEFLLESGTDWSPSQLNGFRGLICGAGPLLKETATRFEKHFQVPIRHGYGLSETTCYSCFLPNDLSAEEHHHWLTHYEFPSIGVPIHHNEMTILDGQGHSVPEGIRGEICIRGQTICSGYLKRPDANEAAFQWGWFRSGDEGFLVRDQQGRPFFFISGRIKELIIRGGVNISPLEIDEVLRGHPSVKFAMAVPFENRFYGEEIAGYVVLHEGSSPPSQSDIMKFCQSRLPFAKCPKVILFGDEVPYTATGKPKRLELKSRLSETLSIYRDQCFKESGVKEETIARR